MTKHILAGVILGSALMPAWAQNNTLIPTLNCASTTSELNTGYDGTAGQQIANGNSDPEWFLAQYRGGNVGTTPPPATGWVAALRPSPDNANWVATTGPGAVFTDAAWLSPRLDTQSAAGNWWPRPTPETANPYFNFYRVQFNLAPEVPPSSVSLQFDYYADDAVRGAFVNGTYQSVPNAGFGAGTQGTATFGSGWVTGLNTLVFSTTDNGWSAGFLARATVASSSICSVSPLSVTKTADKTHYQPGETATYTVTVTSLGLVNSTGNSLADPTPAGLANPQWSCSAMGGATCPSPAGPFPVSFDLPGQASLTFTLTGMVTGVATLDNTATLAPGAGAVCAADTGCTASVSPTYTAAPPAAVPTLGAWALMLLSAVLGGVMALRRRDCL